MNELEMKMWFPEAYGEEESEISAAMHKEEYKVNGSFWGNGKDNHISHK
jgi:hypothetical protein